MAAIVPMGIDFWASRRSPERFEPAMIPENKNDGIIQLELNSNWLCYISQPYDLLVIIQDVAHAL